METRRKELGRIFREILGSDNVYFQPTTNTRMSYPAIVYSRKRIENQFANNGVYLQFPGFDVIVIDKNPDSKYVEEVSKLPTCRHERHYKKDNLNHDAFTIY